METASSPDRPGSARSRQAPDDRSSTDWEKQLPAARFVWSMISDAALREAAGRPEMLIELVRQQYQLSFARARWEVRRFFMTHKT